ncbi:MAG: hypothetical protein ACRCZI_08390 [Cetobacterium sp.]
MVDAVYCIIIVVIILVMFIHITNKNSIYDDLISGFYNGDYDFCDESGIEVFCLYIGDDMDNKGRRSGYILMQSEEDLLINEPVSIKLCRHWCFTSDVKNPKYYDVEFSDLDEDNDFFPSKQSLRFYPNTGKIVLYSKDTIFGVLYKSGFESEAKMIDDKF